MEIVRKLINYGVDLGKISEDYKLVGHRQVRNGTECPGDRLFENIKLWEHYEDYPDRVNDTFANNSKTTKHITMEDATLGIQF